MKLLRKIECSIKGGGDKGDTRRNPYGVKLQCADLRGVNLSGSDICTDNRKWYDRKL
jgi:hypothetical protein